MHHRCRWHQWQMEKSSIRKILIFSFGHLWVVELSYRKIVFFKFILSCQQSDNCSHCLPPGSFTPVANLTLVSLIPVVHLDLRISPRIFEKIRTGPNGILWGWGETDSWKKLAAKNSWTCPFKTTAKKRGRLQMYFLWDRTVPTLSNLSS